MCNVNVMNPQITLPNCAVPLSSAQRFSLVSPLSWLPATADSHLKLLADKRIA